MPRNRARTPEVLAERVDALASALHGAGVDPERAARLLAAAAAATLDALTLDLILDGTAAPAPTRVPAPMAEGAAGRAAPPLAA